MNVIIYICVGIYALLMIALVTVLIVRKKKKKNSVDRLTVTSSGGKNHLFFLFKLFNNVPFLKKNFDKVRGRVSTIYPADVMSINKKSTNIMGLSLLISTAIILITILISGGDWYFICMGIFMSCALFKSNINNKLEKLETKLLLQFNDFLSDFPSYYKDAKGLLEDAIYDALDDAPYELNLHLQKIYDILISPHIEEKVTEYVDYAPDKFILMFVSLCSITKEFGDNKMPDGQTSFLKGLINLSKQVNAEILKKERITMAFASLTYIALGPVIALKPIEWWGTVMMPDISSFYSGTFGTLVMTLTFITSYVAYSLIISLKNARRENIKEDTIWLKIANRPGISEFLNTQISRNYTRTLRIDDKLKTIGDHTGPKAFIVKCITCAIACFIGCHILFFAADIQSKNNTFKNFTEDFKNVIVPNEDYTKAMEDAASIATYAYKGKIPSEDELREKIRETNDLMKNDTYVDAVYESVNNRLVKYQSIYFKWYFMLICIAVGIIGFFAPYMFLSFKIKSVDMSKEDEVNQFNAIVLILMNMDGITLDIILEWVERFAYCYKSDISECIVNIENGPKQALLKLRNTYASFAPFRKFVNALINIDECGVKEAFENIETQQDFYNDKRQLDNVKMITIKSGKAAKIAFAPLFEVIILYLITPIAIYGVKMVSTLGTALSM